MNRLKAAFTLIELLVVIAIIAILAAILFPVFAQAKASAKAVTEISNAKQLVTATLMYMTDHDDVLPKRATINWGGWAEGTCNAEMGCLSWDKLIYPYMKNWSLLDVSLDRSASVPTPFGSIKRSFRAAKNVFPQVGGMPWYPTGYAKPPINGSQLNAPADTIMYTNQRNEGVYGGTWWIWSTWYENWVWWTGSESTRANNPAYTTAFQGDSTPPELGGPNNYWGGVDVSHANRAAFVFSDGSVRVRPKGFIFPGYERRANVRQVTENPLFPGVCIDAFEWQSATEGNDNGPFKDCRLPQL